LIGAKLRLKNRQIFNFEWLSAATQKRTVREISKHKRKKVKEKLREMNTIKQIHRINKVLVTQLNSGEAGKEGGRTIFNYPLEAAALHRDGKCFQTIRICVQGLPIDIV
jgi:hypothetical protein